MRAGRNYLNDLTGYTFFLLLPLISMAIERPSTVHEVYLKGTDYELHVYRIYGKPLAPLV